jgi:hypothetical protein
MRKLLALTALILLTGCEPDKPIVYKYALGTKVMLKLGHEGIITSQQRGNNSVPYYGVKVRQKHTFITRTTYVHEYEIEKKVQRYR